jgi:dTDP-4-dehydrorhamnose reductase
MEIRNRLSHHVIIRTSWLYGVHGNNFVKTIIQLAKERKELSVVDDQKGCPTFAGDLAEAVVGVASSLKNNQNRVWGTYHYCNSGITSWYQFAKKTIELAAEYEKLSIEKIIPISTIEYPTPALRPVFSALNYDSFESVFDYKMRPWEMSLGKMIEILYTTP